MDDEAIMAGALTIVGQGLAGSMLGWACDRRGIAFEIVDRGHEEEASRVGAGLVSPVTGRRLVPTWRFAEWRDAVLAQYRTMEETLGEPLVREMRLRRVFRDQAERKRFEARLESARSGVLGGSGRCGRDVAARGDPSGYRAVDHVVADTLEGAWYFTGRKDGGGRSGADGR
ncbi:MAG: hypothetical protein J6386_19250 [Candidatus Synoicihabitans palmerolidicus]|nr:hypothetical protein [Candidatus Synoicihabitans palmerolidicus]